MENFGNILTEPEVEAAANELSKNMAENMKASIDMCVAATADVAIGELAKQMAYETPTASNDLKTEAEVVACACDTCLEEAGPDQTLDEADLSPYYNTDTEDGLQMALEAVADLKARFEALEERIALFNVRSSHKL
jgi:hypothetical protein